VCGDDVVYEEVSLRFSVLAASVPLASWSVLPVSRQPDKTGCIGRARMALVTGVKLNEQDESDLVAFIRQL